MPDLSKTGRIFYGIAIAEIGLQSICSGNFPYILSLPEHFWVPGRIVLAVIFGAMCFLAGVFILFSKKAGLVSILFGGILLFIFCFYCVPYELLTGPHYLHLDEWENAEKELALAGGAFVIAACFGNNSENPFIRFLEKLAPSWAIIFGVTMISFGILHFMLAKEASTLVPAWIPNHIFWIYFAGVALIGAGVSIILKIWTSLIAALLGTMIFLWFILLHLPRVVAAPSAGVGGEVFSAFLALAYSGTAFVISGTDKRMA